AGNGGDVVDLNGILGSLVSYDGSNPFGSGYLRLVQDGADTVIEIDKDAAGSSYAFGTLLRLDNVDATQLTSDNFDPGFGTPNPDDIMGTSGKDNIEALGGDDSVNGEGGNDDIDGGTGDDVLTGGAGGDTVRGDDGNDVITGDNDGTGVLPAHHNTRAHDDD